jgi:hypothetical protein
MSGRVIFAIYVAAVVAACSVDEPALATSATEAVARHRPDRSLVFDRDARPYGISMERWGELMWKWIFRQPAAANPLLDLTGDDCGVDQAGPVWFLPSIVPGGSVFHGERTCTIPPHKALLVQTDSLLNEFPCPDPAFKPAPGQSLFDFLSALTTEFIDSVDLLELSIDGVAQPNMLDYRFASKDLFHFTGDLSLQTALDGCVTGHLQPAVTDGYLVMVKPLPPGHHTLVWHATDSFGMTGDTTLTYHLLVR